MGWLPSLFNPQGAFLRMCTDREVFLDLRGDHLISLLQSQLLPLTALGVSRGNNFSFTPLDEHQLSCPGAPLPPTLLGVAGPEG